MIVEPQLASEAIMLRRGANSLWHNRIDPIYFVLNRFVFEMFFKPKLPGEKAIITVIEVPEVKFLIANINKHRKIAWLNVLVVLLLLRFGMPSSESFHPGELLAGLASPVIISGVAWYTISFTGVPERFIRHAMYVTAVLFFAVSVSLTVLFFTLCEMTHWAIGVFVLGPIYFSFLLSGILYDNLDGLKAAATRGGPVFSRAQGFTALEPFTVKDSPDFVKAVEVSKGGETETSFTEIVNMIEKHLEDLATKREPMIANTIIADCLTKFIRILSLTKQPLILGDDFQKLIFNAHRTGIDDMNEKSAYYVRMISERLQSILGESSLDDFSLLSVRILEIERIRSELDSNTDGDLLANRQELADFLFVEVFRELLSLVRSKKNKLIQCEISNS